MKGEDNISGRYRNQVDEIINNQSDLDFFDPLSQEEADRIWGEISAELDIDEVWNIISSDLEIEMPSGTGSGIIVRSVAAILIILSGLIPVKETIMDPGINQQDTSIETEQNEQYADLIIKNKYGDSSAEEQVKRDISQTLGISLDKSEEGNMPAMAERIRADLTQEVSNPVSIGLVSEVLDASVTADSNLDVFPDKIPAEISNISPVFFPGDLKKTELFSGTDFDNLKINYITSSPGSYLPSTERGRISGGLITLVRNTWLLNYETFNGLKSESLNTTEFVYFPDVGLSVNYSINKTWSLQAEGFFSSNTGQEYLDYIYGHYSRKQITLNYSTFDLSVKYKCTGSKDITSRSSINIIAGGYISFLHYVYQKINTDLEDIGSQYGKYDLGVRLGGEFEFQIFDRLSIAPGLVLSIGIPNIYNGDGNIPGYLRKTHNGSAGFQLAFYYHFD